MVTVQINGQQHAVAPGQSILGVLRALAVRIPTLCHDDRLAPAAVCRLCLVHVRGRARDVPACATPVEDGMVIETHTVELEAYRRTLLESLARRYPASAVEQYPDLPFHRALREHGVDGVRGGERARADVSHPYIHVDMTRCIGCYRCVRICDEIQGQRVWHVRERGVETCIVPDGPTLRQSSCVGCGACVDTCPTGALADEAASALTTPSEWTRTVCPYCGVGCEINVGTRANHILVVRPPLDAAVNKGHVCVKGRYAFGFVHAADRILYPMIRDEHRGWRRVSWSEARACVADRVRELIDRHGPDSVAMLGSARATNEDNYVIQKFARTVIGTNNVDCCARVCHAPSAAALKQVLGSGLTTNSFDDIERAGTILVCGANVTEAHPVIGARIRQAVRRGAHLIVIDPRRIELTAEAACHLALRPGTNVALLNAMAHVIVTEGLWAREFVEERLEGMEEFHRFIERWPPERAAAVCGVDPAAIRFAARAYATRGPAISFHGLGLTQHVQGTDGVMALINIALLTGNLGRPGAGVMPLRGQNNVQGAAQMGCGPDMLTGSMPLEEARPLFEQRWGKALPRYRGMNLLGMLDAASEGRLRGLWVAGYDVSLTNPNANATAAALAALDLVIVQDMFLNETARRFGTVFLPACSPFEKDGTYMNAERRIQRVRAALRPVGESRPDWRIVSEVARAMGSEGFAFRNPEEIWTEIRSLCPGAAGMTYPRLDRAGLQWPCPTDEHPGTSTLHAGRFVSGRRATLRRIEYTPTSEMTTRAYPFLLMTGRSLYQFNAATMTSRTRNGELRPCDLLDISAADANRVGVRDGDRVQVLSRYGTAVLPVQISGVMLEGQLFATFQTRESLVNAVTGSNRDSVTGTPEYKVTAVRLERLPSDVLTGVIQRTEHPSGSTYAGS